MIICMSRRTFNITTYAAFAVRSDIIVYNYYIIQYIGQRVHFRVFSADFFLSLFCLSGARARTIAQNRHR